MVGNFASFVLPLRAGEFIRPYMLSRETRFTFSTGFMSVVVERFFDLSAVLLTFACVVFIIPQIPEVVFLGAWLLGGLAIAIFIFMALGSFFPEFVLSIVRFCCSFVPDGLGKFIEKLSGDLLEGASVLKSVRRLSMVTLYTVAVWFTAYASFYVTLLLFRLPPSWEVAITVAVVTALAVALPSAPGFVGVYQSACKLTFPLFGLSPDVAVAYSLVSHALQYVIFIGYGLYVLKSRGMSFGDMRVSEAPSEA
jgi:uncharacterized protein (TIRG00374 family)